MSPSSGDAINYTNTVSILMMLPGSTALLLLLVVIIKKSYLLHYSGKYRNLSDSDRLIVRTPSAGTGMKPTLN